MHCRFDIGIAVVKVDIARGGGIVVGSRGGEGGGRGEVLLLLL